MIFSSSENIKQDLGRANTYCCSECLSELGRNKNATKKNHARLPCRAFEGKWWDFLFSTQDPIPCALPCIESPYWIKNSHICSHSENLCFETTKVFIGGKTARGCE